MDGWMDFLKCISNDGFLLLFFLPRLLTNLHDHDVISVKSRLVYLMKIMKKMLFVFSSPICCSKLK